MSNKWKARVALMVGVVLSRLILDFVDGNGRIVYSTLILILSSDIYNNFYRR